MKRRTLKSRVNRIFFISVGIPFLVSLLIHGPLIEGLISENYGNTTALTLQSMANHLDSYIASCENFFFQYLFDENLERFYTYVDKYEISEDDREVYYGYYRRAVKYRNTAVKYMSVFNDYLKGIGFVPEHSNTETIFMIEKPGGSVEQIGLYERGAAALIRQAQSLPLGETLIGKDASGEAHTFIVARRINRIEKASRQGYLLLLVSEQMFETIVSNFRLEKNAGVVISYPDRQEAYASSEKIAERFRQIEDLTGARNDRHVQIGGEDYGLYSVQSESGFYIDYLIPVRTIMNRVWQLYGIFAGVWTAAMGMAFLLYRKLFRSIDKATAGIVAFAGSYRPDGAVRENRTACGSGILEFDSIGRALEAMGRRIGLLVEEEYILRLHQQAAEYKAMQTEINPHFLNNVLSSLIALNRMGEGRLLETAIRNLSQMFRYTCEHGYDSLVGQEFRFIRSYLMLEKLRFEERLEYEVNAEREAENTVIPKLLIQPIVENAMKHGFVGEACMRIEVRASVLAEHGREFVWITVANSGSPIDRRKALCSSGTGLKNVRERLCAVYPDSFFWFSENGGYPTVCNILIVKGKGSGRLPAWKEEGL